MRDISARELKGHNILAVERFQDSTRWMIEFAVRKPRTRYGSPGDEVRLFLTEDGYRQALDAQRSQQIKIKRYEQALSWLVHKNNRTHAKSASHRTSEAGAFLCRFFGNFPERCRPPPSFRFTRQPVN